MAFLSTRAMLVLGVCMAVAFQCAAAASYNVGGSAGWIIPSGNQLYENWASNITFKVGDQLVFNFTTNAHNVLQVTKANYDGCTASNPVKTYTTGPATVNLTASGAQYYICGVTGHCGAGQKLTITVAAASAPSPTPSPTPSSSPLSPPSSPSPIPTPSPSSASSPPVSATTPTPSPTSTTTPSPTSTTTPSPTSPTSPTTGTSNTPSPATPPTGSSSNAAYRSISSLTAWMGMLSGVAAVFFVL